MSDCCGTCWQIALHLFDRFSLVESQRSCQASVAAITAAAGIERCPFVHERAKGARFFGFFFSFSLGLSLAASLL